MDLGNFCISDKRFFCPLRGEMFVPDADSESEAESESDNDTENEDEIEHEEEEEEVEPPPRLVKGLEEYDQRSSTIEDTETINVGTIEEPEEHKIGTTLDPVEKQGEIAEHKIPIKRGFKPVKQKLRKMRSEWSLKVKEEIVKQFKAGYIKVSEYSEWVANVVPVPKKDGKVRVCMDFRDLNKAIPKDDFPLPHIDILVDNTANHALLSFMDGYAGYNPIKMAEEDMHKTAFTSQWETYCYTVMPFGFINAGATYQRTATTLLHYMMHKEVEVYVDDMIVKSKEHSSHFGRYERRAVADFLADNPIEETEVVDTWSFPDEGMVHVENDNWDLYFDGASNFMGYGVGILLISPTGEHVPVSIKLDFNVTNNVAEYEECLLGLRSTLDLGVKKLLVHGDSSLVINQVGGSWKIKSQSLAPYQTRIKELEKYFEDIQYVQLPREENQFADALSKLAALIKIPDHIDSILICVERRSSPAYVNTMDGAEESETESWYTDILKFKETEDYPPDLDTCGKRTLRMLSAQFIRTGDGRLYKKTAEGVLLRCIDKLTDDRDMEEVHDGECGPHMNAHMLVRKIMRLGYY
ncbi:uncharacterized protein LOC141649296 [Silene latifolia]|uniref:uncharacterized protein LOC141649296 n=1 Tax=Silene latifolia TaxID=37657 RepID=UPI003D77D395